MRLVELIKSFGKFRRKRSSEKEEKQLPEAGGHVNPALVDSESSSPESSRSGSLDFTAIQLASSSSAVVNLEEDEDQDGSSVSSVEDGDSSSSAEPQQIPPSFAVRSRLLVTAWRRLKRVKAVGILCALASVLFWSFNGLLIKLNDGYFGVHVLESLTISSFIVCLVYLTFIFSAYGRRPTSSGKCLSSTSSISSFASTISTTSSSSSSNKDFSGSGVSKGVHLSHHHQHSHHHLPSAVDWTVILGVPGERWSLFLRCFLGTISLATFYTSYTYIPLSDATTIRFTSPVFIAAFAHFLVAEPFGLLQVVNSCTTLAGVVLIGRPSFLFGPSLASPPSGDNSTFLETNSTSSTSPTFFHFYAQFTGGSSDAELGSRGNLGKFVGGGTHTAIGLALALISAISISVSMIAMRRMKRTPAPLVIFWFSACNVVLGLLGLAVLGKWSIPPGLTSWAIIGSTTLCNGFDQLFVTLALKLENAGAVAVIQALCVVLSFLFSIAILQETLYWTSALGGAFIFLSVLVLGFAKMATEMGKESPKSGGGGGSQQKMPLPSTADSDDSKGGGHKGGQWRRRRLNLALSLSTAASSLAGLKKQSKSFDIICSAQQQMSSPLGHLSPSTDSLSPPPLIYPPLESVSSSASTLSTTVDSGLYGAHSEPYLLRLSSLRETAGHGSIDGNNNVG